MPGLACKIWKQGSKYGFGNETYRHGRYRRKNTGEFDVSATRIQWKASRTRIRPKSIKKSLNFILLTRAILGIWQALVDRLRAAPDGDGTESFRAAARAVVMAEVYGPQRCTPPPGLGLEKIGKWLVWTIWWCICKLL